MPDELPTDAPTQEPTPAPPPEPAKRGRKPAKPEAAPDLRPLADRVKEAWVRLCADDPIIRSERRKIEHCEADARDVQNRIVVARGAIRARERGLEREAVAIIQKQTGIRSIPGFSVPKPLGRWLLEKKEARARVKAAEQAARMALAISPPAPPAENSPFP